MKLSSRILKGRGPGEIISVRSLYCDSDTVCIFDDNCAKIKKYDYRCHYIGTINHNPVPGEDVVSLGNDRFVVISKSGYPQDNNGFRSDKRYVATLVPKEFYNENSSWGSTRKYFAYNGCLHFLYEMGFELYSLCGDKEKCLYRFITPNPIPNKIIRKGGKEIFDAIFNGGYNSFIFNFSETDRYILFRLDYNDAIYNIMLDKYRNDEVSAISSDVKESDSYNSNQLWSIIVTNAQLKYTDVNNNEIYYLLKITVPLFVGQNINYADEIQKKLFLDSKLWIDNNINYVKTMEQEEYGNTNILVRLKLKK